MVRRIGGEEQSFRPGQAVGEGGTARAGEPLTAPEMATNDERLAKLREIDERWWGVHTSTDLATGRVTYGSAHQHAGKDIGWLLEQVKELAQALADAETRAVRDAERLAALAEWEESRTESVRALDDYRLRAGDFAAYEAARERERLAELRLRGLHPMHDAQRAATPRPDAGQGVG